MAMAFADKTAVAPIGATEFSKDSGRSTLRLAVEHALVTVVTAGTAVPTSAIILGVHR